MNIEQMIGDICEQNKAEIYNFLSEKIDNGLNNYKISDYIFSEKIAEMLTSNEKYTNELKQLLDDRLYDILEKL